MIRSYSVDVLAKAIEPYKEIVGTFDLNDWLTNHQNVMCEDNGSVGLATLEYPGVYSLHWFFKVRGRDALELADKMLAYLFENTPARAVRGLTRTDLRSARWASRQTGMTSYGEVCVDGKDYELFCMTKDEFRDRKSKMNIIHRNVSGAY